MKTAERTLFLSTVLIFILIADCAAQIPQRPFPNSDWKNVDTLGEAFVRISYDMSFRTALRYSSAETDNDTFGKTHDFSDNGYETESRIVEIGNGIRKDYSQILEEEEQKDRKITTGSAPNLAKLIHPYEYIALQDGRFITTARLINVNMKYEEQQENIQWQLTGKTSSIAGRNCSEATTRFHGRDYIAWFCPEIPIDGGPWKFCGLPGLIIKVSDSEGHYSWEMTGIEQGIWPIYEKQYNFLKCSKSDAVRTIKNMYAHPFAFLKMMKRDVHIVENNNVRSPGEKEESISYYYDPLELE